MVPDTHIKLSVCPKISEKQLPLKIGNVYLGPQLTIPIEGQLNIIKVGQILQELFILSWRLTKSDFKILTLQTSLIQHIFSSKQTLSYLNLFSFDLGVLFSSIILLFASFRFVCTSLFIYNGFEF